MLMKPNARMPAVITLQVPGGVSTLVVMVLPEVVARYRDRPL